MTSDFALLSRSPLTITVAGTAVSIPYRPAAVWTENLGRLHVLASRLADDHGRYVLADLIVDRPSAREDLKHESFRILAEASGWKWWEASRLLATSVTPEVLGRLVLAGADPWNRSVGEWCAATYAICVKGHDEKGRLKFDFSLSIPPVGYEDEWDDGEDPAVVAAQVAKLTGKG